MYSIFKWSLLHANTAVLNVPCSFDINFRREQFPTITLFTLFTVDKTRAIKQGSYHKPHRQLTKQTSAKACACSPSPTFEAILVNHVIYVCALQIWTCYESKTGHENIKTIVVQKTWIVFWNPKTKLLPRYFLLLLVLRLHLIFQRSL